MASQQILFNRLLVLGEIEHVTVTETPEKKTVRITNAKHHALSFLFEWQNARYVGYFVDAQGKKSQAVISISKALQATNFVTAFALLTSLRAKQKT